MNSTRNEPPASPLEIHFRHATALAPHEIESLLYELVANLPLAPDRIVVDAGGLGSVRYGDDETLTTADLAGVVAWLRQHPRLEEVWWEVTIAIDSPPARE